MATRPNAPLYQGKPFEIWLDVANKNGALEEDAVSALRSLAEVEDPELVRDAFDQWKRRADREVSPQGLQKIVAVVCALGVGELADEAATMTFQVLRRQRLQPSAGSGKNLAGLIQSAYDGLASLDRAIVLRHAVQELEQGSSFSRAVVLRGSGQLYDWTEDRRSFTRGLIAASRDEVASVALEATRLLATLQLEDEDELVRQRLNEALEEPRLRGAAAAGLFRLTVQPGTVEQAVAMARADDPRTAVIGVGGLIEARSDAARGALAELLNDSTWSPARPKQEGEDHDGPWPRLEAIRGLRRIGTLSRTLKGPIGAVDSPELRAAVDGGL